MVRHSVWGGGFGRSIRPISTNAGRSSMAERQVVDLETRVRSSSISLMSPKLNRISARVLSEREQVRVLPETLQRMP